MGREVDGQVLRQSCRGLQQRLAVIIITIIAIITFNDNNDSFTGNISNNIDNSEIIRIRHATVHTTARREGQGGGKTLWDK